MYSLFDTQAARYALLLCKCITIMHTNERITYPYSPLPTPVLSWKSWKDRQ